MSEPIEVTAEVIEPSNELEVNYTPAVFADNLAALDAYVERQIAPYVGAQLDPENAESIKTGRAVCAELNKLKAPIEEERKRIKRAYEEPLKAFEDRVKQITGKIDKARSDIKAQVDEADALFKERRRAQLEEEYVGCAGAIADVIPFSAVLEDRWLTRSITWTQASNKLSDKTETALKGYKTLQTKELIHKDEVIKRYANTLDLVSALELEDQLNERDREMEAFKAAQEAAQRVAERRCEPVPTPERATEPTSGPAVIVADAPAEEPVFCWALSMEFTGSRAYAERVGAALKSVGVTGASIKCMGAMNDGN